MWSLINLLTELKDIISFRVKRCIFVAFIHNVMDYKIRKDRLVRKFIYRITEAKKYESYCNEHFR